MMTFSEMIETGATLYPDEVDTATRTVIFDWFQFRKVCDDARFPAYFKRVLVRDFPRYAELLRIQPTPAHYDWFVENYLEREITDAATTGVTRTATQAATESSDTTGSASDTDTNTETESTAHGGTTATTTTGTAAETHGGTTATTRAATGESVRSGGESVSRHREQTADAVTETETENKQTQTVIRSGSPEVQTRSDSGTAGAVKSGPMDAGITSATAPTGGTNGSVGALAPDFSGHASQISQGLTVNAESRRETIDETTATAYSGNPDKTTTTIKPWENDETEVRTYDDVTDTAETHDTETVTHGQTVTETTGGTETVAHGETITVTKNLTGGKTGSTSGHAESERSTTGSEEQNTDHESTRRERVTGRYKEPAEIIRGAADVIMSTSAWVWLAGQLEPLFISTYDELEVDEWQEL